MPHQDPRAVTMAAIACFLAQEGGNLDYLNAQGNSPLDLCMDSAFERILRSYKAKSR